MAGAAGIASGEVLSALISPSSLDANCGVVSPVRDAGGADVARRTPAMSTKPG